MEPRLGGREGSYSEVYPAVSQDADGMRRLFRQFSATGGIPSHVRVTTPGSNHEGGELGYVLLHAFVIDEQPQLQWLDMEAARRHCAHGASVCSWASNDDGREPDVVLAAAGDVATLRPDVMSAAASNERRRGCRSA